jgi:glucose/mannose-6-phosphate isomerase
LPKPTILDDPEKTRKIDKSNMLSFSTEAAKHYGSAAKLATRIKLDYPKPRTIVVAGMGGSAIGGELLKDWTRDRISVPVDICREYALPKYVDKNTLVFVVSYSGETEETLSVLRDAVKRKCMIISVSSGGKLQEFAERFGFPHLLVPAGMAPRATLPYLFTPLPKILERLGLVSEVDAEVAETVRILKRLAIENAPERQATSNFSKTLALNINGTAPVVYGFGVYRAAAQRFKTQFNENSKNPAKWEYFPELNHNEIVGWEKGKQFARCFSVIFIRDDEEPVEIKERIEFTKEMVCKSRVRLFEVWSKGKSSMAKMSSVICMGDFTSVYLAILRGIDPTPVKTIVSLKERLKQIGVRERVIRELEKLAKK